MTTPIRPSEVTTFIRCPRLWHLRHVEGWQPPAATWEPWQLMGSAVHAGLRTYWDYKQTGNPLLGMPEDKVKVRFEVEWPKHAPPEFSREGLEAQSLKVLSKTLDWIKVHMADAEPILVEHTLREDGCTPDLVTREQGQLVVTDWKTHWNLDAAKVAYRLEGIERTHQFLDYAWAVEQHLGEPVALVRKVVIVGSPRIIVRPGTFRPTPEMLAQWLAGAQQMWHDMHEMRAGHMHPYQREAGCLMYGPKYPCPMYDACWTCHGDREKMGRFYTREGAQ